MMLKILPLLLLLLGCHMAADRSATSTERPNIVLILVDDLGYHDLGATGSDFYLTPHIDRLAETSVRFTQGYAGSRVCSPSRATLMLGQFTPTHGIADWIGAPAREQWRRSNRHTTHLPPDYVRALPDSAVTLAEALNGAGYRTFFAGKWHLGDEGSLPTDHGFDINVGGHHRGSPPGGFFAPYNNPQMEDGPPGESLTRRLGEETRAFIVGQAEQPFFAMLSFYAVHAPLQTDSARWRRHRDRAVARGLVDSAFQMERRLPIRTVQDNPIYAGMVQQMDEAVGLVLDALDSLGIADNTIVFFTSDNGGVASGDAYATSNLPLRGGKGYQWEGGTREPFFLRAGDRFTPKDVDVPVHGVDVYPTLMELAGVPLPEDHLIEGESLLPLLGGEGTLAERPLYWHYPHYGNQGGDPSSVIRRGDWKLIHYYEDGSDELYKLATDPGERENVAAQYPDRTASLRAELMTYLDERDARYPYPDPDFNAGAREQKLRYYQDTLLGNWEQRRREILREDFVGRDGWWGSKR